MAKETFLQKARESYEGSTLEELEFEIRDNLSWLMQDELGSDESVDGDLRTLLALRLFRSEELVKAAADGYEWEAYEPLREHYAAIFRNPDAIDQWMYLYCVEQTDYYIALRNEEKAERWNEITKAMERMIRKKVE